MSEPICSACGGDGCSSCKGTGGQPMGQNIAQFGTDWKRKALEQQLTELTCAPKPEDTPPTLILRAMLGARLWELLNHPGREAKGGRAEGDNDQGKGLPGDGSGVGDC
jgi:hypothetical protein